jgi:hypothetical protein
MNIYAGNLPHSTTEQQVRTNARVVPYAIRMLCTRLHPIP